MVILAVLVLFKHKERRSIKLKTCDTEIRLGGPRLGKAAVAAPLYISVAWILMIGYQMSTRTAVATLITHVNMLSPSVGSWLFSRMDTLVFIYAFAWVFLLSSAIPSVILGKERSVLIQFFLCLTITFMSLLIQDALIAYGMGESLEQLFGLAAFLNNPFIAVTYLSMPYILMIAIDIRSRKRCKKEKALEKVTEDYIEDAETAEQIYPRFNTDDSSY